MKPPRGAVTSHETFVPLGAPISDELWTTARPTPDNTAEMQPVQFFHHFNDGEYRKECRLAAGSAMGKHVHSFDHFSELESGTATLVVDGVGRRITGPERVLVKAGRVHEVHAVTDIVWWCIHKTDETDPAKIDKVLIR